MKKSTPSTQAYIYLLRFVGLGFIVFALFRVCFISRFGSWELIFSEPALFSRFAKYAFLFDAQVIAYILLLPSLLALGSAISPNNLASKKTTTIFEWYFAIIYTLATFVMVLDQQYYLNFRSHFNMVLFDFFEESPLVLVQSIWKEHPVLWIIVIVMAIYFLLKYISGKILAKPLKITNSRYCVLIPIAYFVLLALALRGSVSLFALQSEDVYVSELKQVNDCVPNALIMLKYAFDEGKNQFDIETSEKILKDNGFCDLNDAIATYHQISREEAAKKPLEEWIFKTSPTQFGDKRYNVVIVVVESWSNKLIDFHSPHLNLLCSMEKHLNEDIVFRNFQSATQGTINTLEELITCTPYQPLFTSKHRFQYFPTSIAEPFNQNNYQTEFISGIELSWRNLLDVLPCQKFRKAIGKFELLKDFPEARYNDTWGIYDHDMLNYVFRKLQKQSGPNFFLCLTSTSHTPFEFPDNYPLPAINLSPAELKHFNEDRQLVESYLKGYQYSNKALGDFMDAIKNSNLASNTIVVITGDHNVRMILKYNDKDFKAFQHSVPLYIYLPPELKQKIKIDVSRLGSHQDIIPTLAPLILNNTRYAGMGQNLFDPQKPSDSYYSINAEQVLHGKALSDEQAQRIAKAREVILKLYFQKLFLSYKGVRAGNY